MGKAFVYEFPLAFASVFTAFAAASTCELSDILVFAMRASPAWSVKVLPAALAAASSSFELFASAASASPSKANASASV